MKKKIIILLLSLILLPAILLLSACNKSVEFKINFIVDNEIYDTISTTGNTTLTIFQQNHTLLSSYLLKFKNLRCNCNIFMLL